MKRRKVTVNRRCGIVDGVRGGLAQLGYFAPPVKRVVKRWSRKVREEFIWEYYFSVAMAALWKSNDLEIHAHARAHWPLIWELAAAAERVRQIPPTHPAHWLLLRLFIASNDLPWGEIALDIKSRGGPLFSESTLRQEAKRLGLVVPAGRYRYKFADLL